MGNYNYEEVKKLVEEQESILRFEHFSNREALLLGQFITDRIYEKGMAMSVAVWHLSGAVLYQHLTKGTNLLNQKWMFRKFNTVSLTEKSSLRAWANEKLTGEDAAVNGLNEEEYAFVGGGFPIRLTDGELVGVLTVSNLPHIQDHNFAVSCLSQYLNKEVPLIPEE